MVITVVQEMGTSVNPDLKPEELDGDCSPHVGGHWVCPTEFQSLH